MKKTLLTGIAVLSVLSILAARADELLQTVAVIGARDNRETLAQYGLRRGLSLREVQQRFGATGVFACGRAQATGNLVLKRNVVVTAAHMFEERTAGKCIPRDIGGCYFETINSDGSAGRRYRLKPNTMKLGSRCSPNGEIGSDWAVVELERDVTEFDFYDVADVQALGGRDYRYLLGLKTSTVAARNDNLKGYQFFTKTICEDQIRFVESNVALVNGKKRFFQVTCCSAGGGNSGGPVVIDLASRLALVGIMTRTSIDSHDHKPCGLDNFSAGPLLEGDFYNGLMSF